MEIEIKQALKVAQNYESKTCRNHTLLLCPNRKEV